MAVCLGLLVWMLALVRSLLERSRAGERQAAALERIAATLEQGNAGRADRSAGGRVQPRIDAH